MCGHLQHEKKARDMKTNNFIKKIRRIALFGIPFDALFMGKEQSDRNIIYKIVKLCVDSRKSGISHYIATINMDFINKCYGFIPSRQIDIRQKNLLEILCSSDIIVADGMPLVALSRIMNIGKQGTKGLPQRVTGADLVPHLAALSSSIANKNNAKNRENDLHYKEKIDELRLYFLGGGEGVAHKAVDTLLNAYPYMSLAGIASPQIFIDEVSDITSEVFQHDINIIEKINNAKTDILFLALGNPKQEFWFHNHRHLIRAGVVIGVGGALDFLAGNTRRAPLLMQRFGFEWLWRFFTEPKRLALRYTIGIIKLFTLGFPMILVQGLCFAYSRCVMCTQVSPFNPVAYSQGNFGESTVVLDRCSSVESYIYSKSSITKDKESNGIQSSLDEIILQTPQILTKKFFIHNATILSEIYNNDNTIKHQLIFDMYQTQYADSEVIAVLVSLFYKNNKRETYNDKENNKKFNNVISFRIKNVRQSMYILLWSSGALASLRKSFI